MRLRDALQAHTGHTTSENEGAALSRVATRLIERVARDEEEHLRSAERHSNPQTNLELRALERRLAEARAASLFDERVPCASRFDFYVAMKEARSEFPDDQGVRLAALHAQHLWNQDRGGHLTTGDVARLRARYAKSNPRSKVAEVIERAAERVSFAKLPVAELARIAAEVRGADDAALAASFQTVCAAHGLTGDGSDHRRARAFIASLVNLAHEEAPTPPAVALGTGAALDRVAQAEAPMPAPILSEPSALSEVEYEVPHDETTEVIDELTSPNSGDPMVIELGVAESEADFDDLDEPDDALVEPALELPEHVASLMVFGQVDAFDIGGGDGEVSTVIMDDPTAPGQQVEVSVAPTDADDESDFTSAPTSVLPMGMENESPELPPMTAGRRYEVWSVQDGQVSETPIEAFVARGMPAALSHVARRLRSAGDPALAHSEVRADPETFNRSAFVVLNPTDCLWVTAADATMSGEEALSPEPLDGTEHLVQHNIDLDIDEAGEMLTDENPKARKQNVPKSAALVHAQLQARGITPETIEARVLDGGEVRVGSVSIALAEDGSIAITRGARVKTASLAEFDDMVGQFMALAANEPERRLAYSIRPYFRVDCRRCGSKDEYTMPDTPADVRCGSCGTVTPMRAVALQLEASGEEAYPGYFVVADVPGEGADLEANARRMLSSIKAEGIKTESAALRGGRLELSLREAGVAEVNRIRRIFADVYGAEEVAVTAQLQQAPVQQMPTPENPSVQPGQLAPQPARGVSTPNQQELLAQGTDPMTPGHPSKAAAQAPSRAGLPVGPGVRHVLLRHEDRTAAWIPVEAANDATARRIVASYMDGSEVLAVVDSRTAQLDDLDLALAEPPSAEPDLSAFPAAPAPSLAQPGAPENIETAAIDPEVEATVRAALMHYRNTGIGIVAALDQFTRDYRKFLDGFGDEGPARHQAEAAVFRIAKEVYEKPARLISGQKVFEPKLSKPGKPSLKPNKVFGPDSSQGEGFASPKVEKSHAPSGPLSDTSTEPGSDSRDPGSFGAAKPKPKGKTQQTDWGQSYADTSTSPDTSGKDNKTTKKWDSVSSGAGRK